MLDILSLYHSLNNDYYQPKPKKYGRPPETKFTRIRI